MDLFQLVQGIDMLISSWHFTAAVCGAQFFLRSYDFVTPRNLRCVVMVYGLVMFSLRKTMEKNHGKIEGETNTTNDLRKRQDFLTDGQLLGEWREQQKLRQRRYFQDFLSQQTRFSPDFHPKNPGRHRRGRCTSTSSTTSRRSSYRQLRRSEAWRNG